MVVGQPKRDARPRLVETRWHQAVVDLHARHVVHELTRRDDPARPPGDHALLERYRPDGHGAVAHAGKCCRMPNLPAVEEDALEPRGVEEPRVAVAADR